jgi:glycosyltransferase involved in cell wall biosynthesis
LSTATPIVSVLLPVYNAADTVAGAAASILTGNDVPLELILIDDGSTDGSGDVLESIARDPRVRVLSHPNMGLGASLNRGIAAATAPFIARMDADDVSMPGRLDAQVQFLCEHPDVVLVGGQVRRTVKGTPRSTSDLPLDHGGIVHALLHGHHAINHPAVMMRKSALDAIGGYWTHRYGEEWDLFLRLSEVGRLANLDRHVLDYTYGESGMNATGMETMRAHFELANLNFRRRARGIKELDLEAYMATIGFRERLRIRAQSRSLKAYRRSMLLETSNPSGARLLLAEAAVLWPPFATRRIGRALARRAAGVRQMHWAT